jgi:hypothetical protein
MTTARLTITQADGAERAFTIAPRCSAAWLAELIDEVSPPTTHKQDVSQKCGCGNMCPQSRETPCDAPTPLCQPQTAHGDDSGEPAPVSLRVEVPLGVTTTVTDRRGEGGELEVFIQRRNPGLRCYDVGM